MHADSGQLQIFPTMTMTTYLEEAASLDNFSAPLMVPAPAPARPSGRPLFPAHPDLMDRPGPGTQSTDT
jgi:hypothetical protein